MAVTINGVRFSYCNLFQPRTMQDGSQKYGVTILIPKTNAQAKAVVDAAIEAATNDGVQKKWGGQRPPLITSCVHDGDGGRPTDGVAYGEECKGCWVLTASSKDKPFVVDAMVQNIINPAEAYSGMWGNVNVNFYSYNNNKKGIGCGLNGVQKTGDGEPLSGHVTAEEAFKPVAAAQASAATYTLNPAYAVPTQYPPQWNPQVTAKAAPTPAPAGYDPITGQPLPF